MNGLHKHLSENLNLVFLSLLYFYYLAFKMDDDLFEPIQQDESEELSFIDRVNQNGQKIIQFQENQIQIQNSINELQSSLKINQISSIHDIQELLLKISSNLEKIRENSLLNGEIINQIKEEHEELEEEFSKMKKSEDIQAEIKDLVDIISNK